MSLASLKTKLPLIIGGTVSVAAIAGMIVFVIDMLNSKPAKPKPLSQTVTFVKPTPQPEPEPPPEEEKIEEEVEIPEPEAEPEEMAEDAPADDMPPMGELGLDADGVAGVDGFGLMARKGGRSLLDGGGQSQFDWYAKVAQQDISDFLYENEEIRRSKYSIELHLWVGDDGKVKKYKLMNSTGDSKVDKNLKLAIAELSSFQEAPPNNMPQPIKLKIVSRL